LCLIASSAPQDDSGVQKVAAAINAGTFQNAIELAERELASRPRDKRILTLRGIAQEKLGSNPAALDSFRHALEADPQYLPALKAAAELEYHTHLGQAASDLDRLLALTPGDKTAHGMRGAVAWEKRDCAGAVQHFRAAGELLDTQPAALHQYGLCLSHLQQEEAALRVFVHIHQLQPEDRSALYAIASLDIRLKRFRDAIDVLQPLASTSDPDARALLADAYEESGDTPKAVQQLREAIVLVPDRTDFYVQFASFAMEHGSFQVGIDMLNAGLQRQPRSAELLLARGVLLVQLGKYDDADRDFAQASLLDPHQTTGFGAQALAALQADQLADALSLARSSLKDHPNDSLSWYVLSEVLIKRGALPGSPEFSEALKAAENATRLKPDFAVAGDLLSRLYLQADNTDAAIRECRRVLTIDPQDETALYRLVRALKKRAAEKDLAEVPDLMKRLADARKASQARQADASRYRLVE
jgi:tetratricopeptide (TPR) repeat protein